MHFDFSHFGLQITVLRTPDIEVNNTTLSRCRVEVTAAKEVEAFTNNRKWPIIECRRQS
jgi:hypothetical protein